MHIESNLAVTLPPIHYIYIGKPPTDKFRSITQMLKVNRRNSIILWIVKSAQADTIKLFEEIFKVEVRLSSLPKNFEIRVVESYLAECQFEEFKQNAKSLKEDATTVLQLGKQLLGWETASSQRGTIRDKVTFKELLALFIAIMGGFILDANSGPATEEKDFFLPALEHRYFPKLPGNLIDVWAMFAPAGLAQTKQSFDLFVKSIITVDKEWVSPHDQTYIHKIQTKILDATVRYSSDYKTWATETDAHDHKKILVPALKLSKVYQGSWMTIGYDATVEILIRDNAVLALKKHIQTDNKVVNQSRNEPVYGAGPGSKSGEPKFMQKVTPLHLAIYYAKPDCVQLLLDSRANTGWKSQFPDKPEWTPLQHAASLSNPGCLTVIQQHFFKKMSAVKSKKGSWREFKAIAKLDRPFVSGD